MITLKERERECVCVCVCLHYSPVGKMYILFINMSSWSKKRNIHIDSTQEQILGKCKCESKGKKCIQICSTTKKFIFSVKNGFFLPRFYHLLWYGWMMFKMLNEQFHQHVYAQLLRSLIPKAQKAAWFDCLFCAFGICEHKNCALNAGEIDPRSLRSMPRVEQKANFIDIGLKRGLLHRKPLTVWACRY